MMSGYIENDEGAASGLYVNDDQEDGVEVKAESNYINIEDYAYVTPHSKKEIETRELSSLPQEQKEDSWWARLQATELISPSGGVDTVKAKTEGAEQFAELTRLYKANVTVIARQIIEELHLPDSKKTIKPASLGGIAGGLKYIHDTVIYKFAVDSFNLYGGDEYAQKAAAHELRGLNTALGNVNFSLGGELLIDLKYPLMAVIDYLGHRVIATSMLPIQSGQLVYGSDDGGQTVHKSDPNVNAIMKALAERIHIKGHVVGAVTGKESEEELELRTLYFPGDIEVHKGEDGRNYLLDTARMFPPTRPVKGVQGAFLYQLFRPEFMKFYTLPMSCDAFSRFGMHDRKQHNEEVAAATQHLFNETIPLFVKGLEDATYVSGDIFADVHADMEEEILSDRTMIEELAQNPMLLGIRLHNAGINLRYLPRVAHAATNPTLKAVVALHLVARSLKQHLRHLLRVETQGKSKPLPIVAELLNRLMSSKTHDIDGFWTKDIRAMVVSKYMSNNPVASVSVTDELLDLMKNGTIPAPIQIRFILMQMNVLLTDKAIVEKLSPLYSVISPSTSVLPELHWKEGDIKELSLDYRTFVFGQEDLARGYVITAQNTGDLVERDHLNTLARDTYRAAVRAAPCDTSVLNGYGLFLWQNLHNIPLAVQCFERAAQFANGNDEGPLSNLAQIYAHEMHDNDKAEEYFERCYEHAMKKKQQRANHVYQYMLFMYLVRHNRTHPVLTRTHRLYTSGPDEHAAKAMVHQYIHKNEMAALKEYAFALDGYGFVLRIAIRYFDLLHTSRLDDAKWTVCTLKYEQQAIGHPRLTALSAFNYLLVHGKLEKATELARRAAGYLPAASTKSNRDRFFVADLLRQCGVGMEGLDILAEDMKTNPCAEVMGYIVHIAEKSQDSTVISAATSMLQQHIQNEQAQTGRMNAWACCMLGTLLHETNRSNPQVIQTAAQYFALAVQNNTDQESRIYFAVGKFYSLIGQNQAALQYMQQCLQMDPQDCMALLYSAFTKIKLLEQAKVTGALSKDDANALIATSVQLLEKGLDLISANDFTADICFWSAYVYGNAKMFPKAYASIVKGIAKIHAVSPPASVATPVSPASNPAYSMHWEHLNIQVLAPYAKELYNTMTSLPEDEKELYNTMTSLPEDEKEQRGSVAGKLEKVMTCGMMLLEFGQNQDYNFACMASLSLGYLNEYYTEGERSELTTLIKNKLEKSRMWIQQIIPNVKQYITNEAQNGELSAFYGYEKPWFDAFVDSLQQ